MGSQSFWFFPTRMRIIIAITFSLALVEPRLFTTDQPGGTQKGQHTSLPQPALDKAPLEQNLSVRMALHLPSGSMDANMRN